MQENAQYLSKMMEDFPLSIAIIDAAGNVEYVNRRFVEVYGYTLDDIPTEERWFKRSFPDPEYREQVTSAWISGIVQLKNREVKPQIFNVRRKDDALREIVIWSMPWENGRVLVVSEDIADWKPDGETLQALEAEIAERKQAEEAVHRRNRELALLNHASQAFNSSLTLDKVLASILDEVRHLMQAFGWSVWLVDPETQEIVCQQVAGPRSKIVRGWRLPSGTGLVGWVARHGESVIVPDADIDERHYKEIDRQTGLTTRSILGVPLKVKQNVIGVIQVLDRSVNRFNAADLALMELLAASAAIAIENARLYEAAQGEIAERKRAEKALRESERRYRALIEASPDPIVVTDIQGTVLVCNRQAALLVGFQHAMGLVWKNCFDAIVPEERQRARDNLQKTIETGIVKNAEYMIIRQDGTQLPIELSASLLVDSEGNPEAFVGVLRDITERKQVEDAIKRRNEELTALNTIAAAISQSRDLDQLLNVTLDKVLEVIRIDTCWIQLLDSKSGADEPNLVARHKWNRESVDGSQAALIGALTEQVAQTGQPVIATDVSDAPWFDRDGLDQGNGLPAAGFPIKSKEKVLGVLGILSRHNGRRHRPSPQEVQLLTSIGHQIGMAVENARLAKQAAEVELLRELDRLRSELVANFSHDLRTPLGLIKMSCTTLLRDDVDFDAETQREFLLDIEKETDRLTDIVDNVLDLGRVENGQLRLDKRPADLEQLIRRIAKSMESRFTQHQIVYDFSDEPLIASVDPQRIEEVLRNLLDNAIKYSPDGKTITITGRRRVEQILIQVSDQGGGIPPEELNRVFERFYRVEGDITRHTRGVGLGLAVCRGIVEAHGGRIWVESTPGAGSTFSFTLPVVPRIGRFAAARFCDDKETLD